MVFIAALHFSFIIIYQIITCLCSDSTKHKMWMSVSKLTRWNTTIHNKSQTQPFELQDNVHNKIPEVTFNYSHFQEPLLEIVQEYTHYLFLDTMSFIWAFHLNPPRVNFAHEKIIITVSITIKEVKAYVEECIAYILITALFSYRTVTSVCKMCMCSHWHIAGTAKKN